MRCCPATCRMEKAGKRLELWLSALSWWRNNQLNGTAWRYSGGVAEDGAVGFRQDSLAADERGQSAGVASGGINMTISALDKCYELDHGRPFYRQRPWAILLTVGVAVLMVALLVLLPIGSVVIAWVEKHGSHYISTPLVMAWKIIRYPLA